MLVSLFVCRAAIISITVIPTIVQPDFWELATAAHVKTLTRAHLKTMEMLFVIAIPTLLVIDAPVSWLLCIRTFYEHLRKYNTSLSIYIIIWWTLTPPTTHNYGFFIWILSLFYHFYFTLLDGILKLHLFRNALVANFRKKIGCGWVSNKRSKHAHRIHFACVSIEWIQSTHVYGLWSKRNQIGRCFAKNIQNTKRLQSSTILFVSLLWTFLPLCTLYSFVPIYFYFYYMCDSLCKYEFISDYSK